MISCFRWALPPLSLQCWRSCCGGVACGTILASPAILAVAVLVPIVLLYLALDWLGAAAGGVGRLVMSVIG